jgi:hypothetical protein
MEPYISVRLEIASIGACLDAVKAVMANVASFLRVLTQLYGDLNKIRTSELQLMELKQNASIPEFLTRFT